MTRSFVAELQCGPVVAVPEDPSKHLLLVELRQKGNLVAVNFLVEGQAVESLAVECEHRQKTAAGVPADFGKTLLLLAPRGHGNDADEDKCENSAAKPPRRRMEGHARHLPIPMPAASVS